MDKWAVVEVGRRDGGRLLGDDLKELRTVAQLFPSYYGSLLSSRGRHMELEFSNMEEVGQFVEYMKSGSIYEVVRVEYRKEIY